MNRIASLFSAALLLALAVTFPAAAQQHGQESHGTQSHDQMAPQATKQLKQAKCPVMGLKPSEKLYTDYQGKRIYFCCSDCPKKFMQDPETYMKKLKDQGIELEDAPK